MLALLLAGCGSADAPSLQITRARISDNGTRLLASIAFQPSKAQLAALEHGVPLVLRLQLAGDAGTAPLQAGLVLRYYPLSRRYRLHAPAFDIDSNFAVRGYLFDALARLQLPLPGNPCDGSDACTLSVDLAGDRLPGALRLPALVQPQWRVTAARRHLGTAAP